MIGRTHKTSGGPEIPPKTVIARWRVALSWFALAWEELWPLLWPAAGLAGLWTLLALLDVLPLLPGWVHAAILAGFAAAAAGLLWLRLRRWRLPGRQGALRRIERVNELLHRPLQGLEDS